MEKINKRFLISLVVSIVLHTALIFFPSLSTLFGLSELRFDISEDSLSEELADDEKNANDKDELDKEKLNIEIISKSELKTAFRDEMKKMLETELREQLNLKEEELRKAKELIAQLQEQIDQKIDDKAKDTVSRKTINTYRLAQHVKIILENLDFTQPFSTEIHADINSDGGFTNIELKNSTFSAIIDESIENIMKELGSQRVILIGENFKAVDMGMDSDGENLTLTIKAKFRDPKMSQTAHFLFANAIRYAKKNESDDEEAMTILNNLSLENTYDTEIITIRANTLFVRDAIKD